MVQKGKKYILGIKRQEWGDGMGWDKLGRYFPVEYAVLLLLLLLFGVCCVLI